MQFFFSILARYVAKWSCGAATVCIRQGEQKTVVNPWAQALPGRRGTIELALVFALA